MKLKMTQKSKLNIIIEATLDLAKGEDTDENTTRNKEYRFEKIDQNENINKKYFEMD